MKVLIFCPTAPRLEPEVVESIFNQEGIEFFDVMFTRDNPFGLSWGQILMNIQLNYNKMKQVAFNGQYDKVWIVESDTIPPRDALKKLLEVDAPVVSGFYVLRHGHIDTTEERETFNPNLMAKSGSPTAIGSAMMWDEVKKRWGQTIEVSGGCLGCLLVDPVTLVHFDFDVKDRSPDIPFMQHCWQKGFKQMARLDVVCGHKRPDGVILWPDEEKGWRIENGVRCECDCDAERGENVSEAQPGGKHCCRVGNGCVCRVAD